MVVTIDGLCCQGKSYIGKILASELGLEFLSTGKIVRYVAYLYTKLGTDEGSPEDLLKKAVELMKQTSIQEIENCAYLESEETERAMKIASKVPFVFEEVVAVIKSYAVDRNIVLDGRFTFDIIENAYRYYYFESSMEWRISLARKSKNMDYESAKKYIEFRDSFEKKYQIPEYVKMITVDSFETTEQLINHLKNDIRNEE